jgi:hypothetical protein
MNASEMEHTAIKLWHANKLVEARDFHNRAKSLDPTAEWIANNDYWYYAPDFRITLEQVKNSANKKYLDAKISILIIGHGRPEGAMRAASTARVTATRPELVEILICTDATDALAERYLLLPELTTFVIQEKETSKKWNFLYEKSTGDILVMITDDVIFESWGWDEVLRKLWPDDGIAVMFTDDNNGKELLEFPIISRFMAEILGYAAYPGLTHAGLDTWWLIIGKNLGRLYYLADVWRHRHQHYEVTAMHVRSTRPPVNILGDYRELLNLESEKLKGKIAQ